MKFLKALLLCMTIMTSTVWAERTVTVTLPFPAGGATDKAWRVLDPMLSEELKRHGIKLSAEYRVGAGGGVAGTHVATAPAGETRLLFTSAAVMISPNMNDTINYRPTDFVMLGYFGSLPMVMAVNRQGPATIAEFKKVCKDRRIDYGSAGVGSTVHLVSEGILRGLGCRATHIPYKSPAAALPDLIAGRTMFVVDYTNSVTGAQVRDGQLRNILSVSANRLSEWSNIPTAREVGIDVGNIRNWQALLVNSTANPRDVEIFRQAVEAVLSRPENLQQFRAQGLEGTGDRVDSNFLFNNYYFYQRYIKEHNIKSQ